MVPPPASLPGALNRPSLCAAPLPTSWSILLPPRLKVAPGRWWWQAVGRYRQEEPWQPSERGPALPPAVIMVGLLGLLLFPLLQANREVCQSPLRTIALEGDSVNITCSTPGTLRGIYLKQTWPSISDVIYYEDGLEPTVDPRFQGRIAYSGLQSNLTISLYHLQLADTGGYTCVAIMDDEIFGPGTLVMVTDQLPQAVNTCQGCGLLPRRAGTGSSVHAEKNTGQYGPSGVTSVPRSPLLSESMTGKRMGKPQGSGHMGNPSTH
uniref:Ig-like domain-containing protein n=1 Tax=Capra hircus TaxID=9925 RepID=A0A8C2RRV7_CAPHI